MEKIPVLATERLKLRPFTLADAPKVQQLAGEKDIALTTLNIPHPYEDGMAEEWIKVHKEKFEKNGSLELAISKKEDGKLLGAVGLFVQKIHKVGEIGYWVGKPYWNQGCGTEAARKVLEYGFEEMGLNRIFGRYMKGNPGSGRILKKIGMKEEGCLRQHVQRMGKYHDLVYAGILKSEYDGEKKE